MNSTFKSLLFWLAIVVAAVAIYQLSSLQSGDDELTYSKFMGHVEAGQVSEVTFQGNKITGKLTTTEAAGKTFHTYAPPNVEGLVNDLRLKNVDIKAVDATGSPWALMLLQWAPIALLIGFFAAPRA